MFFMRVRFGYVAIAMRLDKVTSSSPVTYKKYSSIESERERLSLLKRVTQSNLIDLIKILKYNIENDIHFYRLTSKLIPLAIESERERLSLLKRVTQSNLIDLIKILKYNIENDIHFYRLTSKLIPLATHQDVVWNYSKVIQTECQEVAKLIKQSSMRVDAHPDQFNVLNSVNESVIESSIRTLEHQLDLFDLFDIKLIKQSSMRVDAHPDQFNVLNSVNESVIESSIRTLEHQLDLFDLFDIEHGKLVLHVGGKAGGKEAALERFVHTFERLPSRLQRALILENDDKTYSASDVLGLCQRLHVPMVLALERFVHTFERLPSRLQRALILENDDKTYSASDVLGLCQRLHVPMVLDIHHHRCYNEGESLESMVESIFKTWEADYWPPKIHVSSPKEFETDRRHADFIEVDDMLRFLDLIKPLNQDIDVMDYWPPKIHVSSPKEFETDRRHADFIEVDDMLRFLDLIKPLNQDIDVMIEAKQKDLALHRLVHEIKQARPKWQWLDHTTIEI